MSDFKSKLLKETLAKPDIHQQWLEAFGVAENGKILKHVFDTITREMNAPKNSIILDAGCGVGSNFIRLVERGFIVQAIDFSEFALKVAEFNVKTRGLENKINIQHENILSLSFGNETFSYILCWGVLMHISDLDKAMQELVRVLKPKGMLIIMENNTRSLQTLIVQIFKRILRKDRKNIEKTQAGINYWENTSAGLVLTRTANIAWLIESFRDKGLLLKKCLAHHFTTLFIYFSSPLPKKLILGFNYFWVKYIKNPYLAHGNILILQKKVL